MEKLLEDVRLIFIDLLGILFLFHFGEQRTGKDAIHSTFILPFNVKARFLCLVQFSIIM